MPFPLICPKCRFRFCEEEWPNVCPKCKLPRGADYTPPEPTLTELLEKKRIELKMAALEKREEKT